MTCRTTHHLACDGREGCDGIACRDDTIAVLDKSTRVAEQRIAKLEAALETAWLIEDRAGAGCLGVCDGKLAWVDCSDERALRFADQATARCTRKFLERYMVPFHVGGSPLMQANVNKYARGRSDCVKERIAELEGEIVGLSMNAGADRHTIEELTAERDALAELVREVHDGHYDMRSEFVASPDWLARARAALGEGS